jgi:hypothetical protein
MYKIQVGKSLNLKNPQTFNEKLQWLKLNDRKDIYTIMVDKYEAKKYVADKIGEQYIIPTLGIYNNWKEINFDKLPNQFVIKCTHDSGGISICKDKENFDYKSAKKKICKSLKNNYYYNGREWPYKNVKPRILIEEYKEDINSKELIDYKLFCFNGITKIVLTCSNRFKDLQKTFWDNKWNIMDLKEDNHLNNPYIQKPLNFEKMKKIAEKLAYGTNFMRVDFYEINGNLYFGEITFFPNAGFEKFEPESYNNILGNWIKLPIEHERLTINCQ